MASKVTFENTAFDCDVINQRVTIAEKCVTLPGVPLGMQRLPKSCSGTSKCGLFPHGVFVQANPYSATGCPFIDSRNTMGR